jgi:RNA polymerase sigma-70 factor (ECF subfamily)
MGGVTTRPVVTLPIRRGRLSYAARPLADFDRAGDASDSDLARRLAGGDRGAEAELYRRLAPRVRLYGLRHLRDHAAADDLAQDVILMTFESLRAGKVREPEHLASFVLGTCRRVVADLRRGAARRKGLLEKFGFELEPAAPRDEPPLDTDRLARCLEGLAERERSVVVLSFYAERRSDAIGTELGLSPANVRVVRHRAITRLRACLEGTL